MFDLFALQAFNHLLAAAPWARGRLAPFAGRRARITVPAPALLPRAPALAMAFRIAADGTAESLGDGDPDVEITLAPPSPLAALGGRAALMRGARLSGAADFAEALGFVVRNLDWDAEEDLSRLVGDVLAQRLATTVRAFAAAQIDTARRLADNIDEYLRYERPPGSARAETAVTHETTELRHPPV